jgi:ceramide glucosyltransferase
MILLTLLLLLVVAGWIYWLLTWWLVRGLFRARPRAKSRFTPAVSILKPVRGLDPQAYENFASFCRQNYPTFELLFGISDPKDPAIAVVERLQKDFPKCNIRLVIGSSIGSNRKVSVLHHLAAQANYQILVVSDSDMRVTPDYLRRVVAPLADEQIGLVTCPYRGESALTLPAQLEALHMGTIFLPSVVIASRLFRFQFAMGSTMALRRRDLDRMGGFRAIADYLADDYHLGASIAGLGLRVHLSEHVTTTTLGVTSFRQLWHREIRWNRCIRFSRPWEYPGLLLTFSTPLALLLLLCSGFAPIGWQALAISLMVRWVVAWLVTGYTGDWETRRWLLWLPVRDVLSALTWCVGGLGRHIVWRDHEYVLQRGGRMKPLPPPSERSIWERLAW